MKMLKTAINPTFRQNEPNFKIKSGDPNIHVFPKFHIILCLERVKEWEKQQFGIFKKIIGKSGRPSVWGPNYPYLTQALPI